MRKFLLSAVLAFPVVSYSQVIKLEKIKSVEEVKSVKEEKNIYQEEIKLTRQIDLGEILSNLYPEINHIRKGFVANDINLRGFSRDNINVLVDGEKIYGACPNRMDSPIFHVSTPQVEKVVITEGPFDVKNQGSMAGVVNVKTKKPKKGLHLNAGLTAGSFQYKQGYVEVEGGSDKVKALIGYQKRYSKPYKTGEGQKITEYKHPNPINDYQGKYINHKILDIDNFWASVLLTPDKNNELKINTAYDNAESVFYPYLLMDAVYDRTFRISGEYKYKPLNIKAKIYYNKVKHDMQDKWRKSAVKWTNSTKSTRGYMMRTYAESYVKGFKIEKSHFIKGIRFDAGIDGFIRNWKANNKIMMLDNRGMIPNVNLKNIGIYTNAVYKIRENELNFGIRFDNTKSQADENAYGTANNNLCQQYYINCNLSKTDTYLSGFILDKYYIDKKSYIYTGFGHSVRMPDPQERYIALKRPNNPVNKPDWIGNPNLKPSKNNEIDLGTHFKKGRFTLNINGFYSKVKDYIYIVQITSLANPTEKAMSYKNINATFYGGDINFKALLTDYIYLDIGGAYQRGKKDSGNGKDIAEIPPLKIRGTLTFDNLKYYGQVEIIHSFKQDKVDSTLNETPTPSYTVVNIKTAYRLKHFTVGAGIDNIFDKFYYTHLSYLRNPFSAGMKTPEPGRFIYLNLTANF